jgi:phenylacetate-CoA ligase
MRALRAWLHRRQRPLRYAHLEALLANDRASRDEVARRQRQALATIIAWATTQTDFYRARHTGLPGAERGEVALADLPVLGKDEVRAHLDGMLARGTDRRRVGIGHTGGSTGKPLAFWYDEAKHELMRAGMMRSYMAAGWRPGERILNFWGARQDTQAGGVFAAGYGDYVAAETTLPAHAFTTRQLDEWAAFIRAYRPALLQGYASILAELARHVLARGTAMPRSLRGVFSTAEVLQPWQRELMERAFACKVFNQYGSREIPNIACECRLGNVHVFTDMVCLETPPADGDNRLLVTSLTNRLMPMLRYDIGDSGRLLDGECACGWPYPLMEMGICRQNDLIRSPGGRTVHPSAFNRLLYGLGQLRQYQWVQEASDRLRLDVVADAPLPAAFSDTLGRRIAEEIDPGFTFALRHLEAIPRTASGKHRFVIGLGH